MPIRIDKLVSERFALSRRGAQEAIRNGKVDLDGERCDEPGRVVAEDAAVAFFPARPKARRVHGGRLRVLHEDAHVLIVDKPAGLLTLPTAAHEPDTLLDRVGQYLALRHGGRPYAGIVHRLDKETSGALAFARSVEARRLLIDLFTAHDVERQYLAVVEGAVARPEGEVRLNLVTDEGGRRRRVAHGPDEGRSAVTHYRVIERFGVEATLLACWLETGRTHQVRLHLAAIGHPVVGEPLYRPRSQPRSKARSHRQALHAQVLGLRHPITGRPLRVEAPVPDDLAALIADLRNRFGLPNAGG
ncbi:MAG TPA: RluA family pseudouridine synthase [Isosphaeraceae bacterium]|jgi:23S rRNA pseudouridine1911/1915/1917 synthase|nr:RluA family pseudouridine synthase [Isosphaeraceae bacterium]